MAGLYIHIPFCKQACHYCNFHFSTSLGQKSKMIDAIVEELKLKSDLLDEEIATIYFGGGTPSLLNTKELSQIMSTIDRHYQVEKHTEITFEVNPDDVTTDFVQMVIDSGINRLSIGIQSFFDQDLSYMNRAHTAAEARKSLELCLHGGIDNISADLIYGLPTLCHENWEKNIDLMIQYGIPHLSCYQLTVEPKTPLAAFIERDEMQGPVDEVAVQQFYTLLDKMETANYEAYEISNYAKEGYRSKHNSSYWRGVPYLGFGPSAHSYSGNARSWNTVVNNRYLEEINKGQIPEVRELLSKDDQFNEYVLTRLRTMEGLSINELHKNYSSYIEELMLKVKLAEAKNFVLSIDGQIILTRLGKVWADHVTSEFMV